jgi:hypothetical protein
MLGLVRKSTVERLIRETLAERERVVQLLVEQVEYLRAQVGMATTTVSMAAALEPRFTPFPDGADVPEMELGNFLSDEEEQIQAMFQSGALSAFEYERAKERLKAQPERDIIE